MSSREPFVIFALPRSMTRWTAEWLSKVSGGLVGHDMGMLADTPEEWLDWVNGVGAGTVETGMAEAADYISKVMPRTRFGVIIRPLDDVKGELTRLGGVDLEAANLEAKFSSLQKFAQRDNVAEIAFSDMTDPFVISQWQERLVPRTFDVDFWLSSIVQDVQIDWDERLGLLHSRQSKITHAKELWKERVETDAPYLSILFEPIESAIPDCAEMAARHNSEAKSDLEGEWNLNLEVIASLAAQNMIWAQVTRLNGQAIGYCVWTREINIESNAVPTVSMGPLYVAPGNEKLGIGNKLLKSALAAFAKTGFGQAKLHHTMLGRGAKCAPMFKRLGAVEFQREYILPLGGKSNG